MYTRSSISFNWRTPGQVAGSSISAQGILNVQGADKASVGYLVERHPRSGHSRLAKAQIPAATPASPPAQFVQGWAARASLKQSTPPFRYTVPESPQKSSGAGAGRELIMQLPSAAKHLVNTPFSKTRSPWAAGSSSRCSGQVDGIDIISFPEGGVVHKVVQGQIQAVAIVDQHRLEQPSGDHHIGNAHRSQHVQLTAQMVSGWNLGHALGCSLVSTPMRLPMRIRISAFMVFPFFLSPGSLMSKVGGSHAMKSSDQEICEPCCFLCLVPRGDHIFHLHQAGQGAALVSSNFMAMKRMVSFRSGS